MREFIAGINNTNDNKLTIEIPIRNDTQKRENR